MKHLIFLIFLFPYLLWFIMAPSLNWSAGLDFVHPLVAGFSQALLSAVLALVLGLLLSPALFTRSARFQRMAEVMLVAPNFVPPLFIVMSVLSLCQFFDWRHQGLGVVVMVHALMNAGLFAVAFHRVVMERLLPLMETAQVFGVSSWRGFSKIVLPLSLRPLMYTFTFVFGLCLVSFSIPFILGGPSITSLEIHIYRLVRNQGEWGGALVFSLIQSLSIFTVSGLLLFTGVFGGRRHPRPGGFSPWFLGLAILPILILTGFWLKDIGLLMVQFQGAMNLASLVNQNQFWLAGIHSLIMMCLVFGFMLFGAFLVVTQEPDSSLRRFFQGYLAPSVAVLGFSLSLLPGESEFLQLFKSSFAFFLLCFPLLFRWMVLEEWMSLRTQVEVAKVFGARKMQIAKQVLWPQLQRSSLKLALMGGVWALGDFAVSSFFFNGDRTLALKVVQALNSYDLNLASIIGFLIFILAAMVYILGRKGIEHVAH